MRVRYCFPIYADISVIAGFMFLWSFAFYFYELLFELKCRIYVYFGQISVAAWPLKLTTTFYGNTVIVLI